MTRLRLTVIVLLALAFGLSLFAVSRYKKAPRSVILLSIDTLRPDHLGCYGYARQTSPAIDEFARKSLVFRNALTPYPNTTPSVASILTGLHPRTHGVRHLYNPARKSLLTLQRILSRHGYQTAAFVSNWVLRAKWSGLNNGFSLYDDNVPVKELNRDVYERNAAQTTKAVTHWLRTNSKRPFFLWVHYQDPHGPYTPPEDYLKLFSHAEPEWIPAKKIPDYQILPWVAEKNGNIDAQSYRDAYDAEIRYLDDHMKLLFREIETMREEDPLVIVVSDHGESLGEHGYFFQHHSGIYDSLTKVPFIISNGRNTKPGNIEQQVGLVDVTPTILDLLGIEIPKQLEGRSLRHLFCQHPAPLDQRGYFMEMSTSGQRLRALRTEQWKYIMDLKTEKEELYEISADPGETNDVAPGNPVCSSLRERLRAWLSEKPMTPPKEPSQMKLPQKDREALQTLGYL